MRDDWHVTKISSPARASFRSAPWRSPTLFTRDVTARRARYRKCLHDLEECVFHLCDNSLSAFVVMQEQVAAADLAYRFREFRRKPLLSPSLWGEPSHYSGGFVYLVRSSAVTIFARLYIIGWSTQGADIVHNGVQHRQERRLLLLGVGIGTSTEVPPPLSPFIFPQDKCVLQTTILAP